MSIHRSRSASSLLSHLLIVGITLACAGARAALAAEPDIPKIEADAERGATAKQIELGAAYLEGRGVPRDFAKAAYWYERAANSGQPAAQLEIGYLYQAGIGVERDPARATRWFERAAANGVPTAKVNLGVAYVFGLGVRKDPAFGAELFREAAGKGEGSGACFLGDLYYFGLGVPRDLAQARHWFEVGSKLHNPIAKFDLAIVLYNQQQHEQNRKVVKLLRDASAAGYVPAMHQLGLLMVLDPALEETPGEAATVLEHASEAGSWRSSVVLGILARDGRSGVAQDKGSSYYHFRIAILQGGDSAAKLVASDVRTLQAQLGPATLLSLDSEASAWASKHGEAMQFVNLHLNDPHSYPTFGLGYPGGDSHVGMLITSPLSDMVQSPKAFR